MKLVKYQKKHSKACDYAYNMSTVTETNHVGIAQMSRADKPDAIRIDIGWGTGSHILAMSIEEAESMGERLIETAKRLKGDAAKFQIREGGKLF